MAVLGINLPNQDIDIGKQFSFKPMKSLMEYLSTYNVSTQAVAIDGTANDIQTTGTGTAIFCGQPLTIDEDAALDISACTEGTETAWAVDTAYVIGDVVQNSHGVRYMCRLAHTSKDGTDSDYTNNEPGKSDNSDRWWEQRDHAAVNASGTSITHDYEQWFLVTAIIDGTLQIWEAGDEATIVLGAECKIPQFDPKVYVAIGLIHITSLVDAETAFVVGTTDIEESSCVETIYNLTGPIFPHPDNWDKN